MNRQDNHLALHLAVAYTALVVYASLHPFQGWRDLGAPPLAWIETGWLRYTTWFDIVTNVLAYLPFGYLWATVTQNRMHRYLGVPIVLIAGALLSATMETLQNYLPTRVPSNLDFAGNTLGTLFGALVGAAWGAALLQGGRIDTLRERTVIPGFAGDAGLVLVSLWLLTQVNPESLLFGNGDLRRPFGFETGTDFDAASFAHIEGTVAAVNALAIGLIMAALRFKPWVVLFVLLSGMAIRALAAAILVDPGEALRWITQGNMAGVAAGCLLLVPALWLPRSLQRSLAAVALLLATILVNLAPQNPYLADAVLVWKQGHFLNFNGLTRLVSMLWPFLALAWLLIPERDPWKTTET